MDWVKLFSGEDLSKFEGNVRTIESLADRSTVDIC